MEARVVTFEEFLMTLDPLAELLKGKSKSLGIVHAHFGIDVIMLVGPLRKLLDQGYHVAEVYLVGEIIQMQF